MPSAAEAIGFIAWPPVVGALNCSSLGGAGLRFRYLTYVRYDNITPAGAPYISFSISALMSQLCSKSHSAMLRIL